MAKKLKYILVKHFGNTEVMSTSEMALLQLSGSHVKPLKGAIECLSCHNKTYLHGECYHCGFDATESDIY